MCRRFFYRRARTTVTNKTQLNWPHDIKIDRFYVVVNIARFEPYDVYSVFTKAKRKKKQKKTKTGRFVPNQVSNANSFDTPITIKTTPKNVSLRHVNDGL